MTSRLVKLFGTDEPPVETRLLRAGPLSVELDAGNLRYIRYHGHEAIRAVSYVVRDQYWGTFNAEIENLEVEETAEGFTVTYDAECKDETQSFRYAAKITGSADGTLSFEGAGSPVTDFLTNRTGFVVLHPVAGVAGFSAEVEHVDGRVVETGFPERIDPKQPIMDIRAITHEVCPGLKVTCTMAGDSFEMEDQRNWTDASYKTYVRPLGLPFPYTLMRGEGIEQAVTISFSGTPTAARSEAGATQVLVRVGDARGQEGGRVPEFAMAIEPRDTTAALEVDAGAGTALTALAPRFLSCYLDARDDDSAAALAGFRDLGARLGAALALEIVMPSVAGAEATLRTIAAQAKEAGAEIASIAVTHAGDLGFVMPGTVFPVSADFDAVYSAARAAFGLIHHGPASVAPDYDGAVYPAYHVMRGIYRASGAARRATFRPWPMRRTGARRTGAKRAGAKRTGG